MRQRGRGGGRSRGAPTSTLKPTLKHNPYSPEHNPYPPKQNPYPPKHNPVYQNAIPIERNLERQRGRGGGHSRGARGART